MKLAIKWFVIGLICTLVILFMIMLFAEAGRGGSGGGAILTSYSYEALIGMIAIIGYTAGLTLIVPALIISLIGFLIEKAIKSR